MTVGGGHAPGSGAVPGDAARVVPGLSAVPPYQRTVSGSAGPGFAQVYRASYARLVAQLVAVTGSTADAEDMVQEAFIRAAQRWDVVGAHDKPEAWVRRVAINLALSHLRRARNSSSLLARWGRELDAGSAPGPDVGETDRLTVVTALQRLPPRYRVVLALHYLADLDVRAIAAELRVPQPTVKTRLARGRSRLRRMIGDEGVVIGLREQELPVSRETMRHRGTG